MRLVDGFEEAMKILVQVEGNGLTAMPVIHVEHIGIAGIKRCYIPIVDPDEQDLTCKRVAN